MHFYAKVINIGYVCKCESWTVCCVNCATKIDRKKFLHFSAKYLY